MSGSETSLLDEIPTPQTITAAVSSALCLTRANNGPATAFDDKNARKPENRAASSISSLKIADMSIGDNHSIEFDENDEADEIEQKFCPTYSLSTAFERHTGDTYLQTYYEDSDESTIDFPSPGGLRSKSVGDKVSGSRKRSHPTDVTLAPTYNVYGGITGQRHTRWSVKLENRHLWRTFSEVGTEMVITKTGRRMFPHLSISIRGLSPSRHYSLKLSIVPADKCRYKFMGDSWVAVGKVETEHISSEYTHPDSPKTGSHWMDKPINFKLVKLTNNKSSKSELILQSMHKYIIRIVVVEEDGEEASEEVFTFPETMFIAVTAYQNEKITQLKIDHNPYARAFRESIPSETPEQAPRIGGHAKRIKSVTAATGHMVSSSPTPSRSTSPQSTSNSFTSLESGFESDHDRDRCYNKSLVSRCLSCPIKRMHKPKVPWDFPIPAIDDITEGMVRTKVYWADEYHSLYNQDLLDPLPRLDPSSSFSEPYLQACSRARCLSSDYFLSPLKPLSLLSPTIESDDVFYN